MERLDSHIEAGAEAISLLPTVSVAVQAPANIEEVQSSVACLKAQTYPVWEALFVLSENGNSAVLQAVQKAARLDSRVQCISPDSETARELAAKTVRREGAKKLYCRMDPANPFKANGLEMHLKTLDCFDAIAPSQLVPSSDTP